MFVCADLVFLFNRLGVQIIALANLRLKATHGAQTLASGFRREGCSQTWLPKEATVQTMVRLHPCQQPLAIPDK
jgi:hypothetical protein